MTNPGADTEEMLPFDSRPGPVTRPAGPTPDATPQVLPARLAPRRPNRRVVIAGGLAVLVLLGFLAVLAWPHRTQPNAWGGFENGRIPVESLCAVPGQQAHRLRCDAAAAYGRMATAYRTRFGSRLCITDSYRPFDQQVRAHASKPGLTAKPGTSIHGWGLAVDLCGGVNSFGTPQHRWVVANGPAYGWVHPSWAAEGKPRAEPWHFEFRAP